MPFGEGGAAQSKCVECVCVGGVGDSTLQIADAQAAQGKERAESKLSAEQKYRIESKVWGFSMLFAVGNKSS